jgi:hypothetical protein
MPQRLPDPGTTTRVGEIRWRAVDGTQDLLERLKTLRFDTCGDHVDVELKSTPRAYWGKLTVGDEAFFIKGRKTVRTKNLFKSTFRTAPLRNEWRQTWWVREQGFETIEPVLVGELRRCRALLEEFFVCRWITDAPMLIDYVTTHQESLKTDYRHRSRLLEAMGQLLGEFHSRGAVHRQYSDMNLLVVDDPDVRLRVLPIDFFHLTVGQLDESDRAWSFYLLPWYMRRPMLLCGFGLRDLIRFVRAYHKAAPETGESPRDILRWALAFLPDKQLDDKPYRKDFRQGA